MKYDLKNIDIENTTITELIIIRQYARDSKDYGMSDKIRDYLDTKHSYVFDSRDGQVIYHELKGTTKKDVEKRIQQDKQANADFDAWLYSINDKRNRLSLTL